MNSAWLRWGFTPHRRNNRESCVATPFLYSTPPPRRIANTITPPHTTTTASHAHTHSWHTPTHTSAPTLTFPLNLAMFAMPLGKKAFLLKPNPVSLAAADIHLIANQILAPITRLEGQPSPVTPPGCCWELHGLALMRMLYYVPCDTTCRGYAWLNNCRCSANARWVICVKSKCHHHC